MGVVIGTSGSYDLALKTILTQKTVHPLTSTKSWLCGEALMSTAENSAHHLYATPAEGYPFPVRESQRNKPASGR